MKKILLHFIRFYQKTAFFHGYFFRILYVSDSICKFTPTCSEYTYEAIDKYGALKGAYIGIKRIVRCNPWNKGGYDPVV